MLKKVIRAKYTPEFKHEAVRLAQTRRVVFAKQRAALGCPIKRYPTGSRRSAKGGFLQLPAGARSAMSRWRTPACEHTSHALKWKLKF